MPESTETIPQTTIIPPDSRERVLPVHAEGGEPLRSVGITGAGISRLTPGYRLARDGWPVHILEFTLGGSASLSAGGEAVTLRPGQVLLCPARATYRYWVDSGQWDTLWFCLDDREPWRTLLGSEPQVRPSSMQDELQTAMEGFVAEGLRVDAQSARLAWLFAEQIRIYLERELRGTDSPRTLALRRRLHTLWDEVSREPARDWTVATLAERMNTSPSNFHRIVLRHMGCTPQDMVHQLRMRRAQELLLRSDEKLDALAARLGYSTAFAFSRAFKRYAGVPPSAYRNRRRQTTLFSASINNC